MTIQPPVCPASPRNIAAIDAADLGLDFIDRCVIPLTRAMRHLPEGHPDVLSLNDRLTLQAEEYRERLSIIREREDR